MQDILCTWTIQPPPYPSPTRHRDSTSDSQSQFHRTENVIFLVVW